MASNWPLIQGAFDSADKTYAEIDDAAVLSAHDEFVVHFRTTAEKFGLDVIDDAQLYALAVGVIMSCDAFHRAVAASPVAPLASEPIQRAVRSLAWALRGMRQWAAESDLFRTLTIESEEETPDA